MANRLLGWAWVYIHYFDVGCTWSIYWPRETSERPNTKSGSWRWFFDYEYGNYGYVLYRNEILKRWGIIIFEEKGFKNVLASASVKPFLFCFSRSQSSNWNKFIWAINKIVSTILNSFSSEPINPPLVFISPQASRLGFNDLNNFFHNVTLITLGCLSKITWTQNLFGQSLFTSGFAFLFLASRFTFLVFASWFTSLFEWIFSDGHVFSL